MFISVSRYWRRRILQHTTIGFATFVCAALFWQLFAVRRDLISHLSIATAYPALFLMAAAVLLGPWNVLRGRPNPVSSDLRRDLGIWAAIFALLHTAIGLNVHLRGRPWLYFVDERGRLRHDMFGFANDTGAVAAIIVLMLLAISNDISLRRLGVRKWKSLQRWTYAAVVLTWLHGLAFQSVEDRQFGYRILFWVTIVLIVVLQLAGFWRTKNNPKSTSNLG
jgi:sulfoxide reductase heme-binding subunit YedZ